MLKFKRKFRHLKVKKEHILQISARQHRGLLSAARVGACLRAQNQSSWQGKRGGLCRPNLVFGLGILNWIFRVGNEARRLIGRESFKWGVRLDVGRWLAAWQVLILGNVRNWFLDCSYNESVWHIFILMSVVLILLLCVLYDQLYWTNVNCPLLLRNQC